MNAVTKDKAGIQSAAMEALSRIIPDSPRMVEAARQGLKAEHWGTRLTAVSILGKLGPKAKESVPDLVKALTDWKFEVRCAAAWTLMKIGHKDDAVVKALKEAQKSESKELRRLATDALEKIKAAQEKSE